MDLLLADEDKAHCLSRHWKDEQAVIEGVSRTAGLTLCLSSRVRCEHQCTIPCDEGDRQSKKWSLTRIFDSTGLLFLIRTSSGSLERNNQQAI